MAVACFPGTFNPPTVAHLAIAEAAWRTCGVDRVDLVLSRVAIGKEDVWPPAEDRAEVLRRVAATRPWLGVEITDRRHVADIAGGYDVVVMGADKWEQILDPAHYESEVARDAAVAALPRVAVAPRRDHAVPADAIRLPVSLHEVSSTAVREGARSYMLPEAEASGLWS